MSFTITIRNVPDKELGLVLARLSLPRAASYETTHVPDHVAMIEAPKKERASADTKLTMNGRTPGSEVLKTALTMFEKLEAKEGIGTVSVGMFRADLKKRHQDPKIVTRLIHENYLEYLR